MRGTMNNKKNKNLVREVGRITLGGSRERSSLPLGLALLVREVKN